MNIIIIGCGKVGSTLAEQLNNEGHNITLIDKNDKVLQTLATNLDVLGISGNGAMLEVQKEADIKNADLLIAATGSDETNMLCCLLAKKEGHCLTIARIRNREYEDEIEYLKSALGISYVINPDKMCAHEIVRLLRFPSALEIETFYKGRVDMVKIKISKSSVLCDVALRDLQKKAGIPALICIIEREGKVQIPSGDTVLSAGDVVSFIAKPSDAAMFCRLCRPETRPNRSVFFIGGGKVANYCAKYLKSRRNQNRYQLKFIDINPDACAALSESFPDATVINADGSSKRTLFEEGIQNADCVVSVTGIDEENIIMSLTVDEIPDIRLITKVNHMDPADIPPSLNVGSVVCPKMITANEVVRFVRAQESSRNSNIESLYKVAGGRVEAQEYELGDESEVTNILLKDLNLKPQTLIAMIIRDDKFIQPGGNDYMQKGDHVVIITAAKGGIRDIKDILA